MGVGGWPWSGGCGGARGPGAAAAVAAGLTSESRAGEGTEVRVRVEDEGGSSRARSQPRCPPLPIWAGKERKLPTCRGLLCPWFGGGEKRVAGPLPAPFGGLGERRRWGGGRGDGAFSGLSAGRVASGARQLCRFLLWRSPCARRLVLFLEAAPSPREGPPLSPAAGGLPSGQLTARSRPDPVVRGCRASTSQSCPKGGV